MSDNTIRVLHVVPDLIPYGLEKVVASLVERRDAQRFDITVASLYSTPGGTLGDEIEAHGGRVISLGKRPGFDPRMFSRLRGVFRQVQPHVIHSHNYVLRYTLPAAIGLNTPAMVHTIHNVAQHEVDRVGVWVQRAAFRSRVHPVAIAQEVADSYERVYNLPRPTLIPNGIGVGEFATCRDNRTQLRAELGYGPADLLFICVARFFPQKNHKLLLESFAQSQAAKLPHAHLLLAGDGSLEQETRELAQALGIAHRVRFLGRRSDIRALLGASDAFVLGSLWEGNPLSVMEAMAAGLPIAVTAVGGVPELAIQGVSGLIVPPANAAALAGAINQLTADPALRQRLGAAAALRALARFDHRQMALAYESLYESLLPAAASRGEYAAVA
jgi:glycosyltransferase involved in cell wall biosynthesis